MLCDAAPRGIQLRIAVAPGFPAQVDIDTPIDVNDITKVIAVRAPNQLSRDVRVDEVFDCTGQYKLSERVLTRLGRLTIDLEPDPDALAGFMSMAFGAPGAATGGGPYGHPFQMLTARDFCPPLTTLVVGFDDDDDPGVIFKSVAVNSMTISVNNAERLTARVELVGSGDFQPATGFIYPECEDFTPIYMQDGTLVVDGENVLSGTDPNHTTRAVEFLFNNNLLLGDDPFPLAATDIKRLRRADRREHYMRWRVEGRWLDTVSTKAFNRTLVAWNWRVGGATNNLTLDCPRAIMKDEQPGFDGEANSSVLNNLLECVRIPGNANSPLNGNGTTAYSGNYAQ